MNSTPGPSVMVIDDSEDCCAALCALLELKGFAGIAALCGADALALLDHVKPHAIVLDLSLPDVDGVSLMQQIRRHANGSAPIIVVSGFDDPASRMHARAHGCIGYVVKPCYGDELLMLLDTCIEQRGQLTPAS